MVGNVTEISITQYDVTSVTALPDGLVSFGAENNPLLTSLPTLPSTLAGLTTHHSQLSSLPTLPSGMNELDVSLNNLSSLPSIPSSVNKLNIGSNNLTTAILDQAASEFLTGTLPKGVWDSGSQTTTDQPSAPVQAQLTANVTTATF